MSKSQFKKYLNVATLSGILTILGVVLYILQDVGVVPMGRLTILTALLTSSGVLLFVFVFAKKQFNILSEKILEEHRTERIFMPLNKFVEFGGIHKEVKDFPYEKLEDIAAILEPVWTAIFDRAGKQQTIRRGMSHELTIKKAIVGDVEEAEKNRKYELAIINHKISYKVTLKKGQPFLLAVPPILFVVNESLSSGDMLELERRAVRIVNLPIGTRPKTG